MRFPTLYPRRLTEVTAFARAVALIPAAGAVLLMLGLAGTASAATAGTHAGSDPVYTTSQAGHVTGGGRWFRYIASTVTVAPLPGFPGNETSAEVVLGSTGGPPVTLAVAAGGGAGSISYSWKSGTQGQTGHLSAVTPHPGDVLTLSIYYDRQGHDYLTANDITQGASQTAEVDVVPVIYTAAEAAGVINNRTVFPPSENVRRWEFTSTQVTTYTGVHGTLLGPWATYQVIDTRTGTAAGPVVISAPVLWDNGQNFGVWQRPPA